MKHGKTINLQYHGYGGGHAVLQSVFDRSGTDQGEVRLYFVRHVINLTSIGQQKRRITKLSYRFFTALNE